MSKPQTSGYSSGARALALDILSLAARRGRSVEELLAASLKRHPDLPRAERGLLLELVQGVKRWEARLDYVLSQLSDMPLKKLHPLVLQILRLGTYQILMLDRVPARAALHEAGNLAKARGLPRSHVGFINAVLRRLASGEDVPLPDPRSDPVEALSVIHSHPTWVVRRWLARYGPEAAAGRLAANNLIPPLSIRVNTLKTDPASLMARLAQEGMKARPARFSPEGLIVEDIKASPTDLASYREGLWLFQDEGAQLIPYLLPLEAGLRVAEIGAGRGGKTTHLAETMANSGLLAAVDRHWGRLQELKLNTRRWGVEMVRPIRADAAGALPLISSSMDAVILDVPCSSLGILRRHPEIKGRLREEDLATFPPRQAAMLEEAARIIKSEGHLLYITCTTEPEENEAQIDNFLFRHPEFRLATDSGLLPPQARNLVQPPGFFRTSPEDHDLDAFFAAVLAKA
ncbi:MAG: 16S rRNA (cytosine(967)-C(5))-methyltransferase RsmB [Thermodesulfobacteriota bacterium]